MSRSLSAIAKAAANARETDEVYLVLLEINHSSLPAPIRLVNDQQDLIHLSNTYQRMAFELSLPDDRDEGLPRCRITVDNVSQDIVAAVRNMPATEPATVTIKVVLASQPDTIELEESGFTFRDVRWNIARVEGTLYLEDVLREPYPSGTMTPTFYPGLF